MKEFSRYPTDQALWLQLLAGDIAAFEEMMRRYGKLLYRYGTKFTPDQELVKDCIQDLFLDIWEKRNSVNSGIPPRPYLLSSLRRRVHRACQSRPEFREAADEYTFDVEFSIEQKIIQDESTLQLTGQVRTLLNQLPRRQKEVIYLKFFNNLSRDEIAGIMQIAPQTVSNQLQIALRWLQENGKTALKLSLLHFLFTCYPLL